MRSPRFGEVSLHETRVVDGVSRMRELERALEELPVHYREAIVLVVVLEESYLRAAEILDCDIGTIKSRINRGRRMLRVALGDAV